MKYQIEIKLEDVDARREAVVSTHVFDSDVTPILHCDALILDLLVLLNKQLRRYTPEKQIPVTAQSLHTAITRQSPSHPAPNGAVRATASPLPHCVYDVIYADPQWRYRALLRGTPDHGETG